MTTRFYSNNAGYPKRLHEILGDRTPRHIDVLGNLEILDMQGIGFTGSRNVSVEGIEVVSDSVKQISAARHLSVISGYANGVDLEAHYTCLESGGSTIIVLPEGINHFKIKDDLATVWDWNRVVVVSQFDADAVWEVSRAMARNRTVIALSDVMILVEAGATGGTLNAGKESLKLGVPLFVARTHDTPGNQILLEMGAHEITQTRTKGEADLHAVLDVIQ